MPFLTELKSYFFKPTFLIISVGIILGATFRSIISAFIEDIIKPLIHIFSDGKNIDDMGLHIYGQTLKFGHFSMILLDFVLTALVLFAIIYVFIKRTHHKEEMDTKSSESDNSMTESGLGDF
jgi:large conductance mechanosensitive channel